MDHLRPARPIRARSWIVAVGAVSLAACSVQTPPGIRTSVGSTPTPISSIHLIEPESEQAQRTQLHAAIARQLRDRGVALSQDANIVADLAVSMSPSPVGIYASEAGQTDTEPASMATTRERRWYDACEAVRLQASLVLFNRESGVQMKTSKAESMGCAEAEPPVDEIAALLVEDLLAD